MSSKWTDSEKRPIKTDMGGLYEDTLHKSCDSETNWEKKRKRQEVEWRLWVETTVHNY